MNASTYAAAVTEIIDAMTGGMFDYPDSFEGDVGVCFTLRMTPAQAASKIVADAAE